MPRYGGMTLREWIEDNSIPEPNSGCWLWLGALGPKGYAKLKFDIDGRSGSRASRASYYAFNGRLPAGLMVCHRCDNPPCVNPTHLFLGTAGDNARDRDAKGRGRLPGLKGETHALSRLTEAQVDAIRQSGLSQNKLAAVYGLNQSTVSRIKSGNRWRHSHAA